MELAVEASVAAVDSVAAVVAAEETGTRKFIFPSRIRRQLSNLWSAAEILVAVAVATEDVADTVAVVAVTGKESVEQLFYIDCFQPHIT